MDKEQNAVKLQSLVRRRENQLKVYLNDDEMNRINHIRDHLGMSYAKIVRSWIVKQPLPDLNKKKLIVELRQLGGLLKHVAFSQNAILFGGKNFKKQVLEIAEELRSLAKKIESEKDCLL